VFEVPESEVGQVMQMIERCMRDVPTSALNLRVPLEVDASTGPNWNDTKSRGAAPESTEDNDLVEILAET
jgi:hypothetical protein